MPISPLVVEPFHDAQGARLAGFRPRKLGATRRPSYYAVVLRHAAGVIRRAWRHAVSYPLHGFCRARLLREWRQLSSEDPLPQPRVGAGECPV
jgi:hypothetical protein